MKYKHAIAVLAALFCLVLPVMAAPAKVLTTQLVERFISTHLNLQADLDKLDGSLLANVDPFGDIDGFEMHEVEAIRKYTRQAGSHPQIMAVLSKYRWDASYWDVFIIAVFSLFHAELQEMIAIFPSEELISLVDLMGAQIHPDDRALVLRYKAQLQPLLEN